MHWILQCQLLPSAMYLWSVLEKWCIRLMFRLHKILKIIPFEMNLATVPLSQLHLPFVVCFFSRTLHYYWTILQCLWLNVEVILVVVTCNYPFFFFCLAFVFSGGARWIGCSLNWLLINALNLQFQFMPFVMNAFWSLFGKCCLKVIFKLHKNAKVVFSKWILQW